MVSLVLPPLLSVHCWVEYLLRIWIEENIIHALLRVQPSFPCLYFPCCSPADQSLSDRNMYHNGVFRLWFRICRTDFVHDAADCSGQTSDVTLCICFGNHESGVMLPGMISGYFSDLLGYRSFFIYVLIATIPAFLMTYFIPFTYDDSKKKK